MSNLNVRFIDLAAQYSRIEDSVRARISGVLEHGNFILGPEVVEFESALGHFLGVRNVIGVANGTDALLLALMAGGVQAGDSVITTAFSFFATSEVISLIGAKPEFVDVEEGSFNICPAEVEEKIVALRKNGRGRVAAIIAVDLFGRPADYEALEKIAEKYDVLLVEDAAQSMGGSIGRRKCGNFGQIAGTSFFPAKPLGCYGDGGAVMTNDDALAEIVRSLRVHGKGSDKYDNVRIGLNSRLDTIQAAILLEKLEILGEELTARRSLAEFYSENLRESFFVPEMPPNYSSAWAQYTVRAREGTREEYLRRMQAENCPTAIYYGKPLHLQSAYSELGYQTGDFPVSESLAKTVFSIPMHPYLQRKDAETIVRILNAK